MPEFRIPPRYRTWIAAGVVLLLLLLGFSALDRLTREVSLAEVRLAFHSLSPARIGLAIACTAASYLVLTLYDASALRIIGRPLPWKTAALASFTGYTLSHNLGLSAVTGGSARYRVYSSAGLDGPDVARVVAIAAATFWAGVSTVAGFALLLHQRPFDIEGLAMSVSAAHAVGAATLLAVAAVIVLCAVGPAHLSFFGWTLPLPSARQALAQVAIGSLDIAAAGTALFVLVPGADPALLPNFVLAYSLGLVAGLISHVPGGLGIFEAVVVAVLPGSKAEILAALVAYRVIYYLIPLSIGVLLLAWREGGERMGGAARAVAGLRTAVTGLAPLAISAACFVGGAVLLVSGSLPAIPTRLRFLSELLPLPFIEASHIAASLSGTGLVLLAPGLYRRLDGAFVATRALLLAGAAFSLAKGLDYEEAIVCLSLAALLQWTRPAFYRRTKLVQQPLTPSWIVSVVGAFLLSIWIGFFSYRHVEYRDALWWDFALRGDASRFLRASVAAAVLLTAAAGRRLFAPAAPAAEALTQDDWRDVERILRQATRTDAMLAYARDKRLLFTAARDAFLMYQIQGSSWIVMGDPVGPTAAWSELLWRIRALADAAQGRLLLYQIGTEGLDLAIGMGLEIVKYGEEAMIDLAGFEIDTPQLRSLRKAERRAARAGATFEVVRVDQVSLILDELKDVSDEWLRIKGNREKRFSLGRFDPDYLRRFDCAVVRQQGSIIAFANLWALPNKSEISVDLMRHKAETPPNAMDFLFANLLAWGKARGYGRFNLGLAPLSGIEGRRLAPAWARAAKLVFLHGERLYGFRGLRAYKEKFAPSWEPRYIAGPHGLAFVRALRDLVNLISDVRGPDNHRPYPKNQRRASGATPLRVDPDALASAA